MSGGYFNYAQWAIEDVADIIEKIIRNNTNEEVNEWGDPIGHFYSNETIAKFEDAVNLLRLAAIYTQRIDWLLSGDDSEKSFHKRLVEELNGVKYL